MNRKAISPIIFVFIFAMIVAGLLLAWGVSSVFSLMQFAQEADFQKSVESFNNNIQRVYNYDEGSTELLEMSFPNQIEEICITDKDENFPATKKYQDIKYLSENSNNDVFFIPLDLFEGKTATNIRNLKPIKNPICIKLKNGELKARLTTQYSKEQKDNIVLITNI